MNYTRSHLLADAALAGGLIVLSVYTRDPRWACFGLPALALLGALTGMAAQARLRRQEERDRAGERVA